MTAASDRIRVLFVCLGNICRSPMAEAVFRKLVREAGLEHRFDIDSAGIGAWHTGEPPDERATAVAARRGLALTGSARQVRAAELEDYDYVLAMDEENLAALRRLARTQARRAARAGQARPDGPGVAGAAAGVAQGRSPIRPRLLLLREFDPAAGGPEDLDVPDPYYGGPGGFDDVYDMIERAAQGLLERVRLERGL